MASEHDNQEARSEAARVMGSVMTPAKRAAVLKAAQSAGRKKGTLQSEETKAKIRKARLKQEAEKRSVREASGLADPPQPKRPRGRPRKDALQATQSESAGTDAQTPATE